MYDIQKIMGYSIPDKVLVCHYYFTSDGTRWFYATVSGEVLQWVKSSFLEFKDYKMPRPDQKKYGWVDVVISDRVRSMMVLTYSVR